MKGFQISFITEQNQRIEGKTATEWLIHLAKELGCTGTTTFAGVESFGSDGRRHSAKFFELVDQPIEIMMAVTEQQATALFEKIKVTEARLFFIRTPSNTENSELGRQHRLERSPAPVTESPIGAFFSTGIALCVP